MKLIFSTVIFLFSTVLNSQILVDQKISELKAHANPYMVPYWSNTSYLTLVDVSNGVPGCSPTAWSNGLIPFYFNSTNSAIFTLALTSKISNLKINVYINNTAKNQDGICKLEYLGIG